MEHGFLQNIVGIYTIQYQQMLLKNKKTRRTKQLETKYKISLMHQLKRRQKHNENRRKLPEAYSHKLFTKCQMIKNVLFNIDDQHPRLTIGIF